MSLALILDTETTGLDPAIDSLVEVGWARVDLETAALVDAGSCCVNRYRSARPTNVVNGIPIHLPDLYGHDFANVVEGLRTRLIPCTAIVAHNAAFDRAWFPDLGRPWADSMDFEWPKPTPGRSLTAIALAHGVGVSRAHRALDDVLTLAALLERGRELGMDVAVALQRALRPKVKLQALVSYDDREKAKAAGFRWENETKRWIRNAFEDETFEFKTKRIET